MNTDIAHISHFNLPRITYHEIGKESSIATVAGSQFSLELSLMFLPEPA
jgi:hypothetical protein